MWPGSGAPRGRADGTTLSAAGMSEGTPHGNWPELTDRQMQLREPAGARRRRRGPAMARWRARARHNGGVTHVSDPQVRLPDQGESDEAAPSPGVVGVSAEVRAEREAELRSLIELMRPAVQSRRW